VHDVPDDGIPGTTILWMAPNGSWVQKGDLLVELDSSSREKHVDDHVLDTERQRAEQLRATSMYDNRITQNETMLANAELRVALAELNLRSFEDEEGGVFELGVRDIVRQIQVARANELISDAQLKGHQILYGLGYSSRGDVAKSRLACLNASRSLVRALCQHELQTQYAYQKQKLQLMGAVETAKRSVIQSKRNSEWLLARDLATKHAADRRLKKSEERLERNREQVKKCKIYAPQDGMVVYASGIREGESVYERQTILQLPDLSRMQVKTTIHESGVNQVQRGQPATIRLDARPGASYRGSVQSVAVLPDQGGWLNSDVKAYETVVEIDEEVERLHPGMTAVVEIHVRDLHDVLIAPVEAVVQIDGSDWCYVEAGGDIERRMVSLGAFNDRFVEIRQGLNEGDRVILDPTAVSDAITSKRRLQR
jgi:HlyD family secretion protein